MYQLLCFKYFLCLIIYLLAAFFPFLLDLLDPNPDAAINVMRIHEDPD
jgi:hypothetical protein